MRRIKNLILIFLKRFCEVLKDNRAECQLDDLIPIYEKAEEITVHVIDGIKYIVSSHFKKDGKNVAESTYRLMERDSDPV